ncbi:MAG: type II toxin-antitoxin system VapC family toxin [Verrucomicrobiota bacterium]
MKPKLYLETTVPSYLTAWPSRDLIRAGHQQITKEWWQTRRNGFDIYISQFVLDEVTAGDADAANERLSALQNLPLLDLTDDVIELAEALTTSLVLPHKAVTDAAHIAIAAVHGMHFLLTWNCKHIANAEMFGTIQKVCQERGFQCPVICTPEELMGI